MVKLSELRVGDCLRTKTNEVYIYIGYYKGVPKCSISSTLPDRGYLYVFYSSYGTLLFGNRSMLQPEKVIKNIIGRKNGVIEGNGTYLKFPKNFEEVIYHTDLTPILNEIQNYWGLKRLGDKKPSDLI